MQEEKEDKEDKKPLIGFKRLTYNKKKEPDVERDENGGYLERPRD